ncbi:MAG: molecular chaperone DnaJ [Oceanicoccus sp.]|jgi:molecular chaperone DnaJ
MQLTTDMANLYSTLGVEKSADDAEIKKAYRKLVQKYHPDKNPGDTTAESKFKEVQEAYEVLSDKQKRGQYDQFGSTGGSNGFPGYGGGSAAGFDSSQFGGFADIFESFFGGGGGGHGRQSPKKAGPMRGGDIETEIEIKFEEAVFGTTKHLEITKPETCTDCKGTGAEPGYQVVKCSDCNGAGQVRTTRQTILGNISSVHACPKCHGRGETPEKTCTGCKGQMRTSQKTEVSVKIPAGIESGSRVRMQGKGSAGIFGGPHGDLYLYVDVAEHPKFSREGHTIYSQEHIHVLQAVLGATMKVDTIHGKEELKVPAGTQNGTTFKIKGKGSTTLRSEKLGDHLITIAVDVPKKLSKKEKKQYQQLADDGGVDIKETGGIF